MRSQRRMTLMLTVAWSIALVGTPMVAAVGQEPVNKPLTGERLPAPRNVTAVQQADGRIRVTWSGVPGATSYAIVRSVPPDPARAITPNPSDTVYVDSDVVAGKTYYYVLSALNDGATGLKAGTAPVTATRSVGSPPGSLLPPTNVIARLAGIGTVTVSWQSPPGTARSIVDIRQGAADAWITAVRTSSSSYSMGGLAQGMRVQFRVRSENATGVQSNWTTSNEVLVDTSGTAPVSTGGTTATAATGTVAVTMGSALSIRVGATASAGSGLGSRWVSLDEGTATVDASGTVTGRAAGRAQILAIGRGADGAVRVTLVQVTVSP